MQQFITVTGTNWGQLAAVAFGRPAAGRPLRRSGPALHRHRLTFGAVEQ